ncbi:uncharacterized protein LOC110359586 isoform X10 [Columba livia]|uniref:uncharacterized protein LOC110359586 isoform X10 n=1 Tax=Columba livia TaxID=8932 RepID=UPI0031B9E9DF
MTFAQLNKKRVCDPLLFPGPLSLDCLGDEVETYVNILRTGCKAMQHRFCNTEEGWKMVNATTIPEKVPRSEAENCGLSHWSLCGAN